MLAPYDRPPFGVYAPGKVGDVTPEEAMRSFGSSHDDYADYARCDAGFIRLKFSEDTARANGLNKMFDARPCPHGHISLRRVRSHGKGNECCACRRAYRSRAKARR